MCVDLTRTCPSDQYDTGPVNPGASLSSSPSSLLRIVLWQPGGAQGADEDGAERHHGGPCQLPAGGPGARRGPQAHQPAPTGPSHAVLHLQRGGPHLRDGGELKAQT